MCVFLSSSRANIQQVPEAKDTDPEVSLDEGLENQEEFQQS